MKRTSAGRQPTRGHAMVEEIISKKFGGIQAEFARDLGLSAQAVNRWLKSYRKPNADTTEKLRVRHGIPSQAWGFGKDQPPLP